MDSGKMRDRILIQRPTATREGTYNSKAVTWSNVNPSAVWGQAKDVADRNSEDSGSDMRKNTRQREISIRWQAGITTAMRVKVNAESVYFQIVSMADIGYHDEILLACEEYRS